MTAPAAVHVAELCPSCRRFRSPYDMIRHTGFTQCLECLHRHEEALHALATGTPPTECSECHTAWDILRWIGQNRMVCHMENGLYRMMCLACDARYVKKRKELYGPTEFGYKTGLK